MISDNEVSIRREVKQLKMITISQIGVFSGIEKLHDTSFSAFSMLIAGMMSVVNIYPSMMVLSVFQMDAEIRLCGPFSTHFLDADVEYRTDHICAESFLH